MGAAAKAPLYSALAAAGAEFAATRRLACGAAGLQHAKKRTFLWEQQKKKKKTEDRTYNCVLPVHSHEISKTIKKEDLYALCQLFSLRCIRLLQPRQGLAQKQTPAFI